jgi:hypothetical protein
MPKATRKSRFETAKRVQRHRDKLRAMGLKPVQMWVYDTSRPGFLEKIRQESRRLANDPQEKEITDWIQKVQDTTGWK